MPEGKVSVPSTLSGHAAEIYRSAFLDAYEGTCAKPGGRRGGANVNRDACAAKIAWGAVKEGYKKGKNGNWVAKAGDPVVGPISDVPLQTSLPVYGTGVDYRKGEEGTKLQRWRRAYIKALRDECRNADQPVECARRKANAAAGFVETDVKPIQRGGAGSGHHGHKGRPGEVGGSLPSGAAAKPAGVREAGEKYERSPMERRLDGMRKHKFLTKEIEKKLPSLYSQENVTDPIVQAKWFDPWSKWAWFATEYDPEQGLFFGWVYGDFPELGYFSRKELAEVQVKFGLPIERDLYFKPKPLSEVQAELETRAVYRTKGATYPLIRIRGGAGSGHHGHEGRPGEVGGSKPGEGGPPKGQEGFYEMGKGYIGPRKPLSGQEQVSAAAKAGLKSGEAMPKATQLKGKERDKWVKAIAMTNTLAQLRRQQDKINERIGKAYADQDDEELGLQQALADLYTEVVMYQNFPETRSVEKSNGRAKYRSTIMDQFNDYPLSYVERREFDTATRRKMMKAGTAMSDGSFPIATGEDVTFALRSLGRTSKPRSGVIAHIRKRAKAIGFEMNPALKRKAAIVQRYLDRKVLRSQANEVDMQHIHVLSDNPINRPDYISSVVWRSLPPERRTVQSEASYRIVERNYAQAVEDAEMSGWKVSRHYYSPDDYYFTKRFSRPGEDKGVLVRAIMVRRVDSVEWELLAMSDFASSSIARMLPSDIVQHSDKDRTKVPLIESGGPGSGHHGHKGRPGEVGGSLPSGAAGGPSRPRGVREDGSEEEWHLEAFEVEEMGLEQAIEFFGESAIPPELRKGGKKPITERLPDMGLSEIAREIRKDWSRQGQGVNFAAKPYLEAMGSLWDISDKYFLDSGTSVVAYFLSNARTWKGDTARAVKKELNKRLKG